MKIYIPTRGRVDKQITWASLPEEMRKHTMLVVDKSELAVHQELYGYGHVLAAPEGCNSIGKVRQFIIDQHDIEQYGPKLIMLDDDLGFNMRRTDVRSKFVHATEEAILEGFELIEELLDSHIHGGIRARQMSQDAPDIEYNCRTLRALAYNVEKFRELKISFDRLIVMEDFDVTLQLLRKGYSNFNISTIIQGQGASNTAGGCSIYRDAKRQEEGARGLAEFHPDYVRVRTKKTPWANWEGGERIDVTVSWKKAYEDGKKMNQTKNTAYRSEDGIQKFFTIARERYQIMLNRNSGLPKPWTKDPIFQKNRFCNVFREDDRTTKWFRENIRDTVKDNGEFALAYTTVFRWFNKIEIGEIINTVNFIEDDFGSLKEKILAKYPEGPFVTGAYIIKTPDGMSKLDGVLWCVEKFEEKFCKGDFNKIIKGETSMEEACTMLQSSPYLGRFMSYQICADLQHTCCLENAPDIMTWAQPGPGSTRGISRIFYNDVSKFAYGSVKDEKEVIQHMQNLLQYSRKADYWPSNWPQWDMQTVQNFCCEFDKYCRAEGGGHMKRKGNYV